MYLLDNKQKTSHPNPLRHTIAFYISFAPTTTMMMAMAFTKIKQVINLIYFHIIYVIAIELLAISEIIKKAFIQCRLLIRIAVIFRKTIAKYTILLIKLKNEML